MIHLNDQPLIQQQSIDYFHIFPSSSQPEFNSHTLHEIEDVEPTRKRLPSFFDRLGQPSHCDFHSPALCSMRSACEFGLNTDEDLSIQQTVAKRKLSNDSNRMKNQTKNIPKNFGKGIISFIEKNGNRFKHLATRDGITYSQFMDILKEEKKRINTIADLRRLWTDPTIGRFMRIVSNLFFRKHTLEYIFNSRISSYSCHIKYRASLWKALQDPEAFNHIKQY